VRRRFAGLPSTCEPGSFMAAKAKQAVAEPEEKEEADAEQTAGK
jgi:hypothetical protein